MTAADTLRPFLEVVRNSLSRKRLNEPVPTDEEGVTDGLPEVEQPADRPE